jgi:hypothetical protein
MNIIRFNEPFEEAIKVWPQEGLMNPFTKWQAAPLFEYVTTRSKEKHMITDLLNSGDRLESTAWPFETFRLSLTQYCDEEWIEKGIACGKGHYRLDAIVTRQHERIYILANIIRLYDETPDTMEMSRRYNPLIMFMSDCYTTLDNPQEYTFRTNTFAGGRWLNSPLNVNLAQGVMDAIAGFILDSMIPTNHLAEVRPDQPHRSVEWVKARTHYTLITHGHPANKRTVREGTRVTVDMNQEIKRRVHDRKAHYKTLRHPRFKYALNEKRFPDKPKGTIRVKACWCGPKEWRDQGGKQIYKILEPLPEAA